MVVSEDEDDDLDSFDPFSEPDAILLVHPGSLRAWQLWRAFGKQYPPWSFIGAPDEFMRDIMMLETMYTVVKKMVKPDAFEM